VDQPTPHPAPANQAPFSVLLKPTGARCNLACRYCFFLPKADLYPGGTFRMSAEVSETFLRQYMASQTTPEVEIAWQGGEPTMMGLEFFQHACTLAYQLRKPGQTVRFSIQTNGILLNEEWCRFLKVHDFLVGLSIDGPRELHDAYRVDKGGHPTFDKVARAARLLQAHGVRYNALTCVHAANAPEPLAVYRFLRDQIGTEFIQFIPIVEPLLGSGHRDGQVSARSVDGEQYGAFLIAVFDEWVRKDVGSTYVQVFDVSLAAWMGGPPGLCVFQPTCGNALVLEHTGDLYSCDHFVEPQCLLGNILNTPISDLAHSDKQRQFGRDKQDKLPLACKQCDVRFVCNGGCPKNRLSVTDDGDPGLNILCEGYKDFFHHIDGPMRFMAQELRAGRPARNIMAYLASQDPRPAARASVSRNAPCPCGSGRKYKHCCGSHSGAGEI